MHPLNDGREILTAIRRAVDERLFADLPSAASLAWVVLAVVYRNAEGRAFPGVKRLARELGISVGRTKEALRKLREAGMLETAKAPGPGKATEYLVALQRGSKTIPVRRQDKQRGSKTIPVGGERGPFSIQTGFENEPPTPYEQPSDGVSISASVGGSKTNPVSDWPHVTADDLQSEHRLRMLYQRALRAGIFTASEDSLGTFYAAAEHALRKGRDPGALFTTMIQKWPWGNECITRDDERRALARLQHRLTG